MRINILVNEVFDGWEPTDKRLGGTEESVVRWSEELASRGHKVQVFRNPKEWLAPTHYNGVAYAPSKMYMGGGEVCINVKNSEVKPKEPTLYLTNELDATDKDLSKYNGVIWPSHWAKDNIPVNNDNIFVVPHGYDPKLIKPGEKVKNRCLYASSPDRGLETLERIWPSVVDKVPDAHLFVTYNGQIDAPNVTSGEFTEEEMNELYNTSEFWLHPANGGELFCITGIKAQAAQTIPVYFPVMALTETVKAGIPCMDARDMYNKLVEVMGDTYTKKRLRRELSRQEYPTWEKSTDILESVIMSLWK